MSDEIALGQRELEPGGSFEPTEAEQKLLDDNNVSASHVQAFVDASGKQTINDAIGGLATKAKADADAEAAKAGEGAGEAKEGEQAT
jgi:hypothetical protein